MFNWPARPGEVNATGERSLSAGHDGGDRNGYPHAHRDSPVPSGIKMRDFETMVSDFEARVSAT